MHARNRLLAVPPLAALAFAVAHLGFETLNGGVQSHHLLNRPDLPAISNWLGLVILPLLGLIFGLRLAREARAAGAAGIPAPILFGLCGAILYGGMLATAFELNASSITNAAFFGLFLCAALLPIYRAEYLLGFVVGITLTFGAVLPLAIGAVFAVISFAVRYIIRCALAVFRKRRAPAAEQTGPSG
ncbi:MAG: hypothetical protein MUE46_12585 [Xanthomonadales bacterium]|jgi:hypothetical protein|nr:hypothetical protein [Xanthomonadales bacterium]